MKSSSKFSATFPVSEGLGNENIGENPETGFLKFCEEEVEVVVVVQEVVVVGVAQPLTTACKSQSSAMDWSL